MEDGRCGIPVRHKKDSEGNYFTYISVRDYVALEANGQWTISALWKMR